MPAFEAEVGMPYWIDLTTSDVAKSTCFYEEVLGWEVADGEGYRLARVQRLPIAGLIQQPAEATMPDTWVTYFLSRDIAGDSEKIQRLGGRVLGAPSAMEQGMMALAVGTTGGEPGTRCGTS